MAREWKKNEITYQKRYADKRSVEDLARRFGTDESAVRAKVRELGLETRDGAAGGGGGAVDSALPEFEKGLEALHDGDWETAAEHLEKVIAESDHPQVTARARQYLEACRRHAEADEDSEGGDPFTEAVYERNRGELERALELCRADDRGEDERFVYLEASVLVALGELDDAAERLEKAIEMNPGNKVHAYHDPDFEKLREDDDHARLFEL